MRFRYDINALRAIAVLSIIFYHFQIPFFTGGFAGVDVFFVISGYLMSKIILTGFDKSNFSAIDFYIKRTNRIVPALLCLLLFVLIIGSFLFFPDELELFSKYSLSSLFFVSNIFYYLNSGYFDAASKSNPLLHTWSLSVEWQFYIIYPLLLMPLKKIYTNRRKIFKIIIVSFVILNFIATVWVAQKHQSFAFYFFPTRAWEMVVGCIVVLYEKEVADKWSSLLRNGVSLCGYFLIFICVFFLKEDIIWPGLYTVIPVGATALILICNSEFAFKNSLVQFIGKISYSLYLWHWPLYVLAISWGFLGFQSTFVLLTLTFICSYLSFKYIESNKKVVTLKRIAVSALAISVTAFLLYLFPVNSYFINKNIINLSNYKARHKDELIKQMRNGTCFIGSISMYEDFSKTECLNLSDTEDNVLLIGDSHAAEFSLSLREKLTLLHKNLLQATTSYCYPFLNTKGRDENVKLINFMFNEFIPEHAKQISLVIVCANWKGNNLYNDQEFKAKILELIDYLHKYNLPVRIIGQTQTYSTSYSSIAAKQKIFPFINEQKFVEEESYQTNRFLSSFIPKDIYMDVYDIKGLQKISGYTPYMFDDNHLTVFGANQVIDYIEKSGLLNY